MNFFNSLDFMQTLYDILGLSSRATLEQIEQAYKLHINKLKHEESGQVPEQDILQMRAIKDAYLTLSSPARRQRYDEKLSAASQVRYEVVESAPFPWLKVLLLTAILFGGGVYLYKAQANKAHLEQVALEAEKVKAKAELAARIAAAEQANLEREMLLQKRAAEENLRRESEQARREGQQIHYQLEQHTARAAREKEQAERLAKQEAIQEEQAARARVQNQTNSMQRALNIPIRRN
jgi:colicin import membrane protein